LILASKLLEPDVRAGGGRIAQLMTWPSLQYRYVFGQVLQTCLEAARAVDGLCLSAGEAWRAAWALDPGLRFYGPDGYHPSGLGTYLAALMVYEVLTGNDARALPARARAGGHELEVPVNAIDLLQRVDHETVARLVTR
jgi:hypothetical protein